jgi:hypothetical protein
MTCARRMLLATARHFNAQPLVAPVLQYSSLHAARRRNIKRPTLAQRPSYLQRSYQRREHLFLCSISISTIRRKLGRKTNGRLEKSTAHKPASECDFSSLFPAESIKKVQYFSTRSQERGMMALKRGCCQTARTEKLSHFQHLTTAFG